MVEPNNTTVSDNTENGAHNMVKLTIDNCEVVVPEHTTILDAAKSVSIQIPTLCYLRDLNEIGGCRVCVVEVEGCDQLVAACNNYVLDGMVVHTNSPKAREARRTNVQLLLSQHDSQCTSCVRSGNCNLQTIANDLGIFYLPYQRHLAGEGWDFDFPIIRENDKCIKCMRCIKVCESVQGLGIWDLTNRATHTAVGTRGRAPIGKTDCVACGQCITHCPTGALRERDDTETVFDALANPDKIVLVQIAPAVRSAWGEELGISREEATVERLACALRRVGFEYVFDTDFSADLTIMEEGSELIERLGAAAKGEGDSRGWPMFTSCCPGWVRFVKARYPEFVDSLSTSKSPQQMFGAIAKTYYAKVLGVESERLFVVSVMPCTAKKAECALPSMVGEDGTPDVDVALTVREMVRMIRASHVSVDTLVEEPLDTPLGFGTGAGVIFGATGGAGAAAEPVEVHVASLKGPTSIGLVQFMDQAASGETDNEFDFAISAAADEIVPKVIQGDVDIALVPANVASVLYNKTEGAAQVIDINTLGVLNVVTGDASVASFGDLAGHTVYMTGKGATPEYVMNYLLERAGLTGQVTLEFKSEPTEVLSALLADPSAVGVLPEPSPRAKASCRRR